MRVLVTGATGFLGSAVVDNLLKSGVGSVVATGRDSESVAKRSWFKDIEFVSYDIEVSRYDNSTELLKIFRAPDLIIHLAWKNYKETYSVHHLDECVSDHYRFLTRLHDEGLRNFSVVGTAYEYGLREGCLSEEETAPVTPYGVAKDCLRRLLMARFHLETRFRWIRPFNIYGEGQHPKSLLGQLEAALNSQEHKFKMSPGDQIRDFICIKDAADQVSRISLQDKVMGPINCCSGTPITVRKFIENYLKAARKTIELELGHYPHSKSEPMSAWGSRSKLDRALSL